MTDAPMCGMAKNRLLWPIEKHWLNVRFLNGSHDIKELVQSIVEEHFNSLPLGIKFYFYQRGESGIADIRIKFSNKSRSYVGTSSKSVHRSSKPTMRLDIETSRHSNRRERLLWFQGSVLHEFGHALGLFHEHQHPDCGKKWDMALLQYKNGWSQQMVHHAYAPHSAQGKTLEPYDPKSIMHYEIREGDVLNSKETTKGDAVLSEGDKRMLALLYPPREVGMFKRPGDNSEKDAPKKQKWWKRLIDRVKKRR